jgi:dTDP-4-dehydrorhamnose 3,5-epimerase
MKVQTTSLEGVLILEPAAFADTRGLFFESFNARVFRDATGIDPKFVQDNQSHSIRNVLRGIHYQLVHPQGKLVRVATGRVFDVAVDLRRSSKTFRRWVGTELSAGDRRQIWIPPGFGHAFLVLSEAADLLYKTTEYWSAQHDRAIAWNDPMIGIEWPLQGEPLLAPRDAGAPCLAQAETFD